jgi:hypothetical protein
MEKYNNNTSLKKLIPASNQVFCKQFINNKISVPQRENVSNNNFKKTTQCTASRAIQHFRGLNHSTKK